MQAVILAGGRGKRMGVITDSTPKPLLKIGGQPLLAWTLASLPDCISEVLIITGYLHEQIEEFVGNHYKNKKIEYLKQDPLDGTDGAIRQAARLHKIKFPCLVVNGDDLYKKEDLELLCHPLLTSPLNQGEEPLQTMSMLVWRRSGPLKASVVVGEDGLVQGLADVVDSGVAYECSGAYFLTEEYLNQDSVGVKTHAGVEYSLPHTLAAAAFSLPVSITTAKFWLRVGTPEQLENANKMALIGQVPINMI
jgi:NDP-sugar pyrophosphorylase family protein